MKAEEIAFKYVHGKHDALTDDQEKIDMVNDINNLVESELDRLKKSNAELLEALEISSALLKISITGKSSNIVIDSVVESERVINNARRDNKDI